MRRPIAWRQLVKNYRLIKKTNKKNLFMCYSFYLYISLCSFQNTKSYTIRRMPFYMQLGNMTDN